MMGAIETDILLLTLGVAISAFSIGVLFGYHRGQTAEAAFRDTLDELRRAADQDRPPLRLTREAA